MSWQRTSAIMWRQFYVMRGSITRILPLFMWVGIDVVLWGFITRYLSTIATTGVRVIPAMLGAVLLWDFLIRVMQGITTVFLEDVWSRNFLNIFATPLTVMDYLTGLVMTTVITSGVGLATMFLLASLGFGFSFFSYGLLLMPFLVVLFLTGIALGIFASAVVLRLGPAAEWFVWPIPALIAPFAGVFYPLATLPRWMRGVAHLLPPSYVFEGIRSVVAHGSISWATLGIASGMAVAYIGLACLFFTSTYRQALRSGLIARYSAESVS